MQALIIFRRILVFAFAACITLAEADEQQPAAATLPGSLFCVFPDLPPSNYPFVWIKNLKVANGTYGSVTDQLERLVEEARSYGADAIINYDGSQHFGFWPWRVVRPIARGKAIRWTASRPKDCTSFGGFDAANPQTLPPSEAQNPATQSVPQSSPQVIVNSDRQAKLQTLKQAFDQGLITKEEYEAKQAALLDGQ